MYQWVIDGSHRGSIRGCALQRSPPCLCIHGVAGALAADMHPSWHTREGPSIQRGYSQNSFNQRLHCATPQRSGQRQCTTEAADTGSSSAEPNSLFERHSQFPENQREQMTRVYKQVCRHGVARSAQPARPGSPQAQRCVVLQRRLSAQNGQRCTSDPRQLTAKVRLESGLPPCWLSASACIGGLWLARLHSIITADHPPRFRPRPTATAQSPHPRHP